MVSEEGIYQVSVTCVEPVETLERFSYCDANDNGLGI